MTSASFRVAATIADVERAARVVRGGGRPRRTLCSDRAAQRLEVRLVSPLRCEPGDAGLEQEPRLEPLEHVLEPDVGDEEAPVDLEVDEAVAREPPQRLAHRAARDAERVRELGLADPRPGPERAVDDHRAELVVGEPDDGADAERAGARLAHAPLPVELCPGVDIRCSNLLYRRTTRAQGAPDARGGSIA